MGTWAMRKEEWGVMLLAERHMIRFMCGVELRRICKFMLMLADILTLVRPSRMRWWGLEGCKDKYFPLEMFSRFISAGNIAD